MLRVLKAAVSLIKTRSKQQDQSPAQAEAQQATDEQDAAITAQMSHRLEPLWAALSTAIAQIEAKLPAAKPPSGSAPATAASILPAGAAQVLSPPPGVLILQPIMHTLQLLKPCQSSAMLDI